MTKGHYPTMKTVLRMLTMALLMFAVSGFAQTGDTCEAATVAHKRHL